MNVSTAANKGARTPDLRITNASLYQLSHIGTTYFNIIANVPYKININFQK